MRNCGVWGGKMTAHLRQPIHHRDVFHFEAIEQGAHLRRYLVVSAERLGERIHELAVLYNREVEMRSGRKTARSDPTDQVADVNLIAGLQARGDSREMAVNTDHRVVVIDLDAAAKLPTPSRGLDAAVGDRLDRRTVLRGQIYPHVRAVFVE